MSGLNGDSGLERGSIESIGSLARLVLSRACAGMMSDERVYCQEACI